MSTIATKLSRKGVSYTIALVVIIVILASTALLMFFLQRPTYESVQEYSEQTISHTQATVIRENCEFSGKTWCEDHESIGTTWSLVVSYGQKSCRTWQVEENLWPNGIPTCEELGVPPHSGPPHPGTGFPP